MLRQAGSAERAAKAASIPIINAGDGPGQHPTQVDMDFNVSPHLQQCCLAGGQCVVVFAILVM